MVLSTLKKNQSAKIKSINCQRELKDRLERLGLTKGVKVKIVRFSPFGDPIEIRVRGYNLALRKSLLDVIEVEEIE